MFTGPQVEIRDCNQGCSVLHPCSHEGHRAPPYGGIVTCNPVLVGRILGWLGLVYAFGSAMSGLATHGAELGWSGSALLVAAAVAGGACYLAVLLCWRPQGWHAPLLVALTLSGVALHGISPYSGLGFVYVLPWIAAFSVSLRWVLVLGAVDAVGLFAVSLAVGLETGAAVGMTLGVMFSVAFAVAVRQLSVVEEQSEAAAQARAREAVLGERARLAREMHDILAHSLSAQIVHLEGAQLLLERGSDPGGALDRVVRAGQLARAGLAETRQALETLRGDELRVSDRLELLAAEYRTATGARCEVAISGDLERLPPEARLAVARTAQEALTNARKHAPGAPVTVALRCRDGWCDLDVRDTGGPPGELAAIGAGYGLVGMRERAELIGGTLDARPEDTGFRVLLRVPA